MVANLSVPIPPGTLRSLAIGDEVAISGTVYTARDVAHRRLSDLIERGEKLPFDPEGAVIFYAGPTPRPPKRICGVVGPTTSARMDPYTPKLLSLGVSAMIGKGPRSSEVIEAMKRHGAVYFAATGGAAALLSTFVAACDVHAWPELGPEAIWRLELEGFPAFVAVDASGRDLFAKGRELYRGKSGELRGEDVP